MNRQLILKWYHDFALVMGITSHRMVDGRLRQTWLTRYYALALNIIQLLLLPFLFWQSKEFLENANWFPDFILITTYIFYSMSCVAIVYTVVSRSQRDGALVETERLVAKLRAQRSTKDYLTGKIERSLGYLFYLKLATVLYLTLAGLATSFMMPTVYRWKIILSGAFLGLATNIPIIGTYRYFLALWGIAYCYQKINCQVDGLIGSLQAGVPSRIKLDKLRNLWILHSVLNRCTLKMNKIFGLLMLTARLDYVTFTVVDGYWGLLFCLSGKTPGYMIFYGAFSFLIRSLDFFLMDYMCDLTAQYQSSSHHAVSEAIWYRELNAYFLYASTSKLSFWVCGLFNVNRKRWFQMLGSIFNFFLLLLQFHLIWNVDYLT